MNDVTPTELLAGVPETTPVDAFNDNPDGNAPTVTAHVNGPKPPDDISVCEYATFRTPGANELVDTTNGSTTRTDNTLVTVRPSASVTRAVNDTNPADVGDPDRAPVDAFNDTPAGNDPDDTSHEYGARPPAATNDCEYADPVTPSASEAVDTANGANTSTDTTCDA